MTRSIRTLLCLLPLLVHCSSGDPGGADAGDAADAGLSGGADVPATGGGDGPDASADMAGPVDATRGDRSPYEAYPTPDGPPRACEVGCPLLCGDGVVEGAEACDDGNTIDDDGCTNKCRTPRCGDGIMQDGEACDDGNTRDDDRCMRTCRWTPFTAVAVGGDHTCAVRRSGSIVCWGANSAQQAVPPIYEHGGSFQPAFTRVAASRNQGCGLLADGTLQCWGDPSAVYWGPFESVFVGPNHGCGRRADGTLSCWGKNDVQQAIAPPGAFRVVAAGGSHSCGLRPDGKIQCWGGGPAIATPPPDGSFLEVAAGDVHSCAIGMDGRAVCWGAPVTSMPPAVRLSGLTMAATTACALGPDHAPTCWALGAPDPRLLAPPAGSYTQVSLGPKHGCALAADGTIDCWGHDSLGRLRSPTRSVRRLSVRDQRTCVVTPERSIECWGAEDETVPALDGPFENVATGTQHTCGLRPDGSVDCWGAGTAAREASRAGPFKQVIAGREHGCALAPDGTAVCWPAMHEPPAGQRFRQLSAGPTHTCGLTMAGEVDCWGPGAAGLPAPPTGPFLQVFAGEGTNAATRGNYTIAFWGSAPRECNLLLEAMDMSMRPDATCLVGLPPSTHELRCCRPPAPEPSKMRRDDVYYDLEPIRAVGLSSRGGYALRTDGSLLGWGDIALSLDYWEHP